MDTALLKTFLTLYETKSFTATAQKLFRSQSAISLQITRLEEMIGKALFHRDTRKVTLTGEGEQLLTYAHQMLALEHDLLSHFEGSFLKGMVTFGAPEDIATFYLPEILSNFSKDYPDILLQVNCEFTVNLLQGFESGNYDLVLLKQDPLTRHPYSITVAPEPLVWVSNAQTAQDFKESKGKLPLILAPSPCVYRKRAIDALQSDAREWRIVYSSPSVQGTIAAVKAGLGISVLPIKMITKGLQVINYLPRLQDAEISLLARPNSSPSVTRFAEFISSSIASPILKNFT